MDRFKIEGGRHLEGTVRISGSKNASLPAMAAALLTSEPVCLQNIPAVRDIMTMAKLLAHMRAHVESPDLPPSEFTIAAEKISHAEAPYELVKTMRASILTLGPLVARFGYARVSLPGGCAIGARPSTCTSTRSKRWARRSPSITATSRHAARRLRGTQIHFDKITVTGTENILTAAVLAEGETLLTNAAREPEVTDLIELLTKMGAKIEGGGTSTIRVQGVGKAARRDARSDSRPHRSRHISRRRGDHRRRRQAHALRAAASHGGDRKTRGVRRRDPEEGLILPARSRAESTARCGRDHRGISGLRNRHAGAIHDPGHASHGKIRDHRDDFRESVPARA